MSAKHQIEYLKKTLSLIILKHPEVIFALLRKRDLTLDERRAKREALRLIKRFNERPYACPCAVQGCKEPIDFPVVGTETHVIVPHCRTHEMKRGIVAGHSTHSLVSYRAVLSSAASVVGSTKATFAKFVRKVAELKGLQPGQLTAKKAAEFFGQVPTTSRKD
jgi:hypothetical protein